MRANGANGMFRELCYIFSILAASFLAADLLEGSMQLQRCCRTLLSNSTICDCGADGVLFKLPLGMSRVRPPGRGANGRVRNLLGYET